MGEEGRTNPQEQYPDRWYECNRILFASKSPKEFVFQNPFRNIWIESFSNLCTDGRTDRFRLPRFPYRRKRIIPSLSPNQKWPIFVLTSPPTLPSPIWRVTYKRREKSVSSPLKFQVELKRDEIGEDTHHYLIFSLSEKIEEDRRQC